MEADRELKAALAAVEAAETRVYYDEAADAESQRRYYAEMTGDSTGEPLRAALADLLTRSHEPQPRYKPMQLVLPLGRPPPRPPAAEHLLGQELPPARADRGRRADRGAAKRAPAAARGARVGDRAAAARGGVRRARGRASFNCEHVVPQSWFAKDEPMRGDLHHLFACESDCNSFRGNTPYWDFPELKEVVREACGRRDGERFEPASGKGAVARAVLYFLLRYPGTVKEAGDRLDHERLRIMAAWQAAEPVGEYERHRNVAIAELQGNRNPLIDHPDWVERLDFTAVLG